MQILLLEPFFTGSHQHWAEALQQVSQHEVQILSLPGRYWKWRMHGGAISLAREFINGNGQPDLIVATDMLDLSTFLALSRDRLAQVPSLLYFHENQLTYPWSSGDPDPALKRDRHYGFINITSALAATEVWFNSDYHQKVFLAAATTFLQALPDFQELDIVNQIGNKSKVMPLGVDLFRFDNLKVPSMGPATLLWNHRWEQDKNPELFFKVLFRLAAEKIDFRLIVAGESFRKNPSIFAEAKKRLAKQIIHFGYVDNFSEYAKLLWKADIVPVTSNQDFFGVSAVEAIYCNCFPLLPNRLAFPGHIPEEVRTIHLYENEEDLYHKLKQAIQSIAEIRAHSYQHFVSRYDWRNLSTVYDEAFDLIKTK